MRPVPSTRSEPRQIGVVGGVGPQAGLDLVRKILAATRARRDQDHLPVALLSFPHRIPDRTAFLLGETDQNPGVAIADVAETLIAGGAQVVGVPCNTAHAPAIFQVIRDRVGGRCDLVDMVEEVAREIARRLPAVRTVGVLSTTGTLVSGVYPERLAAFGLDAVQLPLEVQEEHVQPAIYDEAYGIKSASAPVSGRAVAGLHVGLDRLLGAGAEAVVLACTEIPLALSDASVRGVPLVDATNVLARVLVRRSCPEALVEA